MRQDGDNRARSRNTRHASWVGHAFFSAATPDRL
jgi:hypothetical protein